MCAYTTKYKRYYKNKLSEKSISSQLCQMQLVVWVLCVYVCVSFQRFFFTTTILNFQPVHSPQNSKSDILKRKSAGSSLQEIP